MAGPRIRSYGTGVSLEPGLVGRASVEVGEADSAIALGSGDVPVLGTPRVVALCERATVNAVASHLEPGQTTVGTRVELDHLAPTPTGHLVTADAELTGIDGRSLTFSITVNDGGTEIARAVVQRVIVDRARFLGRLGLAG